MASHAGPRDGRLVVISITPGAAKQDYMTRSRQEAGPRSRDLREPEPGMRKVSEPPGESQTTRSTRDHRP